MSYLLSQAHTELTDPNSPYFLGRPSIAQEINAYMRGVPYGSFGSYSYGAQGKRNMYIGQPNTDRFESISKIKNSNTQETLFKTVVGGTAAILGALFLRKIPGVAPAVKYTFKGIGNAIKYIGLGIWNTLKWLVKK